MSLRKVPRSIIRLEILWSLDNMAEILFSMAGSMGPRRNSHSELTEKELQKSSDF